MKKSSIAIALILLNLLVRGSEARGKVQQRAPALYVFGDSYSDSGNNNNLPTAAKANFLPYGIDFVWGTTGRFTNGNTFVDYIASSLGLPFVPPYLGLSEGQRLRIRTGINYASGACGILPETGSRLGRCIPLEEQVLNFKKTVKEDLPRIFRNRRAVSNHLAKSIIVVEIGGNDYINNYLQPDFYNSSRLYNPEQFAKLLISRLSPQLKRLYSLGARKIVVLELSAIGCFPVITNAVTFSNVCSEQINEMILRYNRLLHPLLDRLQSRLRGSTFVHGRTFSTGYDVYQNPAKYGLQFTNIPCCVGNQHGTTSCVPNEQPCRDRDKYAFWDAFHPTQAVNKMLGIGCFNKATTVCSPFNVRQLAKL